MDEPISRRYLWDAEAMTEALAAHQRHTLRPVFRLILFLLMLFYVFLSVGIPIWLIVDSRSAPETRRNAAIALGVAAFLWVGFIALIRNSGEVEMEGPASVPVAPGRTAAGRVVAWPC